MTRRPTSWILAGLMCSALASAQDKGGLSEPPLPIPEGACPLNLAIPDDGYNGTLGSMACTPVTLSGSGNITDMNVRIAMNHTWVGDLVIKVVNPGGTRIATIMSRPGLAETADDGTGCCGNSANLAAANPVLFDDQATGPTSASAENMGQGLTTSQIVCAANGICNFVPNRGAAALVPPTAAEGLANFNGQPGAGTWQVCFGDSEALDTGTVCSVALEVTGLSVNADVSIALAATVPPNTGFGSNYTINATVANAGPAAAANTVATITLPPEAVFQSSNCGATHAGGVVTWTIGTLNAGANQSCTITVRANGFGLVRVSGAVTTTSTDPVPANNSATITFAGAVLAAPTLGTWGLVALILGLGLAGLVGVVLLRRG